MTTRRRRLLTALLVLVLGAASLVAVSPGAGTRAALGALRMYQSYVSPVLARTGVTCRFQPTCSRYAQAAIIKYGVGKGSLLSARRLLKCTPLTPMGTVDLP